MERIWDLHKAADTPGRIAELEEAVGRLMMVNRALWEIVRETHSFSDQILLEKIKEIDLRDGKLDGRLDPVRKCSKCGKALHSKHSHCLFCGEPVA